MEKARSGDIIYPFPSRPTKRKFSKAQPGLSREKALMLKIVQPYIDYLINNGIPEVCSKPFSKLLKDFSKKKMQPKCSPDYGLMNKDDYYILFHYLFAKAGKMESMKTRFISRAKYKYKDIVLTYFALDFPEIMQEIANDYFSTFQFRLKLHCKEEIAKKWNEYVDEIQKLKKKDSSIEILCDEKIEENNDYDFSFNDLMELSFNLY